MRAGYLDITIEQGSTFQMTVEWKPDGTTLQDLTNWTARLQVRRHTDASAALVSLSNLSGITLGGVLGTFVIEISAAATTLLDFPTAVYDLEAVDPNGKVHRVLEGKVDLAYEVTR